MIRHCIEVACRGARAVVSEQDHTLMIFRLTPEAFFFSYRGVNGAISQQPSREK